MTNVKCEMWVHNNRSFMSDSEYETMQNSNCTWIGPKCDFFNFSDSFFNEQFNLESENRFDLLAKGHETKSTETLTSKNSSLPEIVQYGPSLFECFYCFQRI